MQQHLYDRFYRFVTSSLLLREKDMSPFLPLDEVFAVIYKVAWLVCLQTFYFASGRVYGQSAYTSRQAKKEEEGEKKEATPIVCYFYKNKFHCVRKR